MLDHELVREYNRLESLAWAIIERQNRANERTYQTLAGRLAAIDGRMAEIERSVAPQVLYASL